MKQPARPALCAARGATRFLAHSIWWVCVALAFVGSAKAAVDVEGAGKVALNWAAASGPVAGYGVFVSKNGSPFPDVPTKVTLATDTATKVSGKVGDTVFVRVAAFDGSGNYGPPSTTSELIRFVKRSDPPVAGPPPVVPNGGSGGGAGGGDGDSIDGVCDRIGDLEGESKIKLVKGAKVRTEESLTMTLCDGRWTAVAADGTRLSGYYEVMIEARKYALFLDRAAYHALVDEAVEDSEGLVPARAASWFPQHPRIRVKLNKTQTRAKFKVSSDIMSSIAGQLTDGNYALQVSGKVVRQ